MRLHRSPPVRTLQLGDPMQLSSALHGHRTAGSKYLSAASEVALRMCRRMHDAGPRLSSPRCDLVQSHPCRGTPQPAQHSLSTVRMCLPLYRCRGAHRNVLLAHHRPTQPSARASATRQTAVARQGSDAHPLWRVPLEVHLQ